MMKRIYKYIIGLATAVSVMGCDEDKFLTQENPNSITPNTFWKTSEDFQKATNTVYGALQYSSVSGSNLGYGMVRSDLAGTEAWYPHNTFADLTFNDATEHVQSKWNELYAGIFRANQIIDNINNEDSQLTADQKAVFEAEAKFLRAYFYFEVLNNYGKAIVHTTVPQSVDVMNRPLQERKLVVDSVIIPDLTFAVENLPSTLSVQEGGKATWGAATALLGKVYLYDQNWTQAATEFKKVIDSRVYTLMPNIRDNFSDENEYNSESIFETNYSNDLKPGAPGAAKDDHAFETGGEATAMGQTMAHLTAGGYNTVITSYYLHELMVYDEKDSLNPINEKMVYSQRAHASIAPRDYDLLWYGEEASEKNAWGYGQSAYVKKFSNWYQGATLEPNQARSGINYRHIRLADVYLMYAEAILEANGNGAVDEAIEYIDAIRGRSAVVTLKAYMAANSNRFPQLHISKQVHGDNAHKLVPVTAVNVLTHIRRVERPLELCFEGHRWKDLVRWGIVKQILDENRADEEWRLANFDVIQDQPPLNIAERIRPDYANSSVVYNPVTHDYYPIPTSETQINTGLGN